MDDAGHGEAVLGLVVVDRMAAHHRDARGRGDVGTPAQDLAQDRFPELFEREGHEVQRGDGPPTHRVDVGERVGGRDPPEVVGVVHDRREEVGRVDERQLVGEPVDAGVVGRLRAHEDVRVDRGRQPGQQRLELGRADLAPAAGAVREGASRPRPYDAA